MSSFRGDSLEKNVLYLVSSLIYFEVNALM